MKQSLLDVVDRRAVILDHLRDGPFAKRDLLDRVDVSRSTLDRAIAELSEYDLVRRADGGYEATLTGVLALERRRAYDRDAKALAETAPALRPVAKEDPVDVAALQDAEVTLLEDQRGVDALATLRSLLRSADAVRALVPQVTNAEHLDALHAQAVDETPLELVVSAPVFDVLAREYPGWLQSVIDGSGALYAGDIPGYGLFICDVGTERVAFLLTYDDGRLHAIIRNGSRLATEWADDCFSQFRDAATDVTSRIRRLDADGFDPTSGEMPLLGGRFAVGGRVSRESGFDNDALLGKGYAVDGGYLRTPEFGTEGGCTVSLWMRPAGFDTDWQVLVKWEYLSIAARRGEFYGMVYDDSAGRRRAEVAIPVEDIEPGIWQHVAYTYDETEARLFLDGECVARTKDSYPLDISPVGAAIGYHNRETGVHDPVYEGSIFDARFYSTALSAEEIERLAKTTAPTKARWESR